MSNVFTLDSLREEVDKEFAPVKIEMSDGTHVTLKNLLRLPQKKREEALALIEKISSKDESTDEKPEQTNEDNFAAINELLAAVSKILELVASDPRKLIRELDGDINLVLHVLNKWLEGSQTGEAVSSPDSSTSTASS